MNIFKRTLILLMALSLAIIPNNSVEAEEAEEDFQLYYTKVCYDDSVLSFYGDIKQINPSYSEMVDADDFELTGYMLWEDGVKSVKFEPRLTNAVDNMDGTATLDFDLSNREIKKSYWLFLKVPIKTIDFDPTIYCEVNNDDIVQIDTMFSYKTYGMFNKKIKDRTFNHSEVKFYNSLGQVLNVNREFDNYTYNYGFNKIKYYVECVNYNSNYGSFILEILPEAKATTIKSNAIALTKNSLYEYRKGKNGKWQSARTFKNLKPDTDYTFYVRTKATDEFPHGTEVEVKVKTIR